MRKTRRQLVAFAAAAAWILQAWLAVTHVHPHGEASCSHAATLCQAHDHEHADHDHDGHPHVPVSPTGNEHDSSDCQICRLLAQQPLPLVVTVELTDAEAIPDEVIFTVDVPTLRTVRLFQSRAPPTQTI